MLRLDSYPAPDIAAQTGSPAPSLLTCVLHSGVLPTQQSLTVWVGGRSQPCEQEDRQMVATWQCAAEVEMEIHLTHQGRTVKAWRGWWKGGATLVHTGTLPLHVFCAGQAQPALGATAPSAPSPAQVAGTYAQHNGLALALPASETVAAATAIGQWPPLAEAPPTASPLPPVSEPPEIMQEDDLWRRAEFNEEGEEPEQEEEFDEEDEGESDEEEEGERGEDTERKNREQDSSSEVEVPPAPIAAPAGTTVAAMHVCSAWSQAEHERLVERLGALLATLPANTILVDLRRQTPTPRSKPARRAHPRASSPALGLTKEVLRALYGARYWDRGGMIPTSQRQAPGRPSHWYRVVSHAQSEGLGELVAMLTRGFSLLLLDSIASYAQSERAAVLTELRQRVPTVTPGACS